MDRLKWQRRIYSNLYCLVTCERQIVPMLFYNSCDSAMELLLPLVRFLLEISHVKNGTKNLFCVGLWKILLIILAKSFSTYSPGTLQNPSGIFNSFYSSRIL